MEWNVVRFKFSFPQITQCYFRYGKLVLFIFAAMSAEHNTSYTSLLKVTIVVSRVYQEANILSRLRHENIVRILGVIKWPDSVGLVGLILEYADNGNLQDLLSEGNHAVLSWSTRLRLTKEIVSGLAYIHNYNEDKTFCHGDLKPENILLTSKMQVKLADFGSASLIVATGSPATTLVVEHTKQYTLQYVDPDFLRDPLQEKKPCMDMYR